MKATLFILSAAISSLVVAVIAINFVTNIIGSKIRFITTGISDLIYVHGTVAGLFFLMCLGGYFVWKILTQRINLSKKQTGVVSVVQIMIYIISVLASYLHSMNTLALAKSNIVQTDLVIPLSIYIYNVCEKIAALIIILHLFLLLLIFFLVKRKREHGVISQN